MTDWTKPTTMRFDQEFKGTDDSLPVTSDSSPLTSVGGILKVPTGPGLGVTIDPAYVKKATIVS